MYQAPLAAEHPREAPPPAGKIELTDATKIYAAHGRSEAVQPAAGTPGNGTDEAGTVVAFAGISLTVSEGELLCLLGRSGCGKSTLLHIIAGLEELSAGSLAVDGRPVDGPSHRRGLVFQQYALFPWLDVYRNVRFGLEARNTGMDGRVKDRAVRDLLALVGLEGFEGARPHELSGGMAQRVAIARALVNEPEILLLDEPFNALDAFTRMTMQDELVRIVKQRGMTAIFVTHDIDEALYLGDRVAILTPRPGRIREIVPVPIDRPRDRNDPTLLRLRDHVYREFGLAVRQEGHYSI